MVSDQDSNGWGKPVGATAGDPVLVAISKEAGSNLTSLYNAVKILRRILEENDK